MPSHWSGSQGGAELQSMYITQFLLKKNDVDVHYICRNFKQPFSTETVHIIPPTLTSKYCYAADRGFILKKLKEIQPDYIYQRVLCSYTGIAAQYCKNNTTKLIFHIANSPDVEPQTYTFSRRIMFDWVEGYYRTYGIKHADYIIAQARYQADSLKQNYGRECSLIMPNISPDVFDESPSLKPINHIQAPKKKIILWVANIKPQKGPDKFLTLAADFQNNSDVEFHMAGKVRTQYASNIQQKAATLDNVVFHGELEVSEVNHLMANAFLFVNTSEFEGFPNTFIQAWLNKTPVVSLNVDPDSLITKYGLGFHCKTEDNLLNTIKVCIESGQTMSVAGSKCREFALDYFSINNADHLYHLISSYTSARRCEHAIS